MKEQIQKLLADCNEKIKSCEALDTANHTSADLADVYADFKNEVEKLINQ